MSLVSSSHSNIDTKIDNTTLDLLQAFTHNVDSSHPALQTPYPQAFTEPQIDDTNAISSTTTPSNEDKNYYANSDHSVSSRAMSQPPHNPNIPGGGAQSPNYANGQNGQNLNGGPYSPYAQQQQDMQQHGSYGASNTLYQQPRPDWGSYGQPAAHHGMQQYPGVSDVHTPTTVVSAGARSAGSASAPGQVYSFVPIPGAQQHKRPRRRFEEIERMYKCGFNGCEKAYGTLNHLNAHVTMQSHGIKRTPEEFKEIRKEWKARKKEEDAQRKQHDDNSRRNNGSMSADNQVTTANYQQGRATLPPIAGNHTGPIGYQPGGAQGQYQQQPAPTAPVQQIQEYGNQSHVQYNGYPSSPYGVPPPNMYNSGSAGTQQHNNVPKYEPNGHGQH